MLSGGHKGTTVLTDHSLPPGILPVCRNQTRPSSFPAHERRRPSAQVALWDHAGNVFLAEHTEPTCNSAHAFTAGASAFERLQRVVNSCERNYHRALKELQRQQTARAKAVQSPQPEDSTTTSESSAPFRTTPQTVPAAAPNPPEIPQIPLCDSASLRQDAPAATIEA